MESFGMIESEFINLYSKENPILEPGNNCFFLVFNNIDYHRPLIASGIIIDDKFTDGMNKAYWIKLNAFYESPTVIDKFILNKPFNIYIYNNSILGTKKLIQFSENFDREHNLFRIEAFFVRKNEESIVKLRDEYVVVIKKDIQEQLKDIENI